MPRHLLPHCEAFCLFFETRLESEAETGIGGRVLRVIISQLDCNCSSMGKSLGGPFTPKLLAGEGQGIWHGGYLTPGRQWQAAVGTEKLGVRGKALLLHIRPLCT